MQEIDTARLLYLVLLGAVIASWYFVEMRANLGRTLKQAMAWLLIFIGIIAAVGLWQDIQRSVRPMQANVMGDGRIIIPRAANGHYYLTLNINDIPVPFVVDTGATDMVLTRDDARKVGFSDADLHFFGRANTANGIIKTAPVTLATVRLAEMVDTNVRAFVNGAPMDQSLLGMGYLQRFSRLEISGGKLILTR